MLYFLFSFNNVQLADKIVVAHAMEFSFGNDSFYGGIPI